MRLLADENFPGDAVKALRQEGHDVAWIRTDAPGLDDQSVLAHAIAEKRVLVTLDKDFGELAFRVGLPAACGIILFRLPDGPPAEKVNVVCEAIRSRPDWRGTFAVATERRIRMRKLPGSS